jgi:acyl carrier protein
MTSEQESRLQTITAEALGVDPEEITEHSSPETLAAWTSFSHLTLLSAVEEGFGLTFSMEEMTGVHDYAELRALVARSL